MYGPLGDWQVGVEGRLLSRFSGEPMRQHIFAVVLEDACCILHRECRRTTDVRSQEFKPQHFRFAAHGFQLDLPVP